MSELENYAEYPKTIGEAKSDKTNKSKDWSARDMLIFLLREIDKGDLNIEKMLIATVESVPSETDDEDDEIDKYRVWWCGDFPYIERLGVIELIKKDLL